MKSLLIMAIMVGLLAPRYLFAQELKPIYDGRLSPKPGALSAAEETLMKEKIIPAAAKMWREEENGSVCEAGFKPVAIDVARGSFTRAGSDQRAILYRYCSTGHNMALNGIAVFENGRVASHLAYEGSWDNAIGALPDINGNGLSEILIATGGTNQGVTWGTISIIELSENIVLMKFGRTGTLTDNCGINEDDCTIKAFRISVKKGNVPDFYREAFVCKGAGKGKPAWKKSEALKHISPENDETNYQFIR